MNDDDLDPYKTWRDKIPPDDRSFVATMIALCVMVVFICILAAL